MDTDPAQGLALVEIADGVSVEDVKAATGCEFQVQYVLRWSVSTTNVVFFAFCNLDCFISKARYVFPTGKRLLFLYLIICEQHVCKQHVCIQWLFPYGRGQLVGCCSSVSDIGTTPAIS